MTNDSGVIRSPLPHGRFGMNHSLTPGNQLYDSPLDVLRSVVPILVWELDPLGEIRQISSSHLAQLALGNLPRGGSPAQLVHPRDHDVLRSAIAEALAGSPADAELRLHHSDGAYVDALFTFYPVRTKSCPIVAVGRLIGSPENEPFRTLCEISPTTSYVRSLERGASSPHFGRGIQKLTGYHRAWFESGKVDFRDLIDPSERERVEREIHEALEHGRPFQVRFSITTRTGIARRIEDNGRGTWNSHGELLYLAGNLLDVSEISQLESEKDELERRLSSSSMAREERIYPQDLNGLLLTIIGNIEFAREHLPESDPSKKLLTEALSAAVGASQLLGPVERRVPVGETGETRPEPESSSPLRGRILVIEDEEAVRRLVTRVLRRSGFAVTVADNGESGLRELGRDAFDLVILDMKMPEFSGEDFLREATAKGASVPVLAVSGHDLGPHVKNGYRGAFDFLPKPYRPNILLKRIDTLLGRTPLEKEPYSGSHVR